MAQQSPFITHRDKVLGYYSTAGWLRALVLAMWNGSAHKVGLSQLASLDDAHATATLEMIASYRRHGENDPAFMSLADECRKRLEEEQAAAERSERLDEWCRDAQREIRRLGGKAGIVDDRYNWFVDRFDAGDEPEAAARLAVEIKLSVELD